RHRLLPAQGQPRQAAPTRQTQRKGDPGRPRREGDLTWPPNPAPGPSPIPNATAPASPTPAATLPRSSTKLSSPSCCFVHPCGWATPRPPSPRWRASWPRPRTDSPTPSPTPETRSTPGTPSPPGSPPSPRRPNSATPPPHAPESPLNPTDGSRQLGLRAHRRPGPATRAQTCHARGRGQIRPSLRGQIKLSNPDLDHVFGLVQLAGQPLVLPPQPGHLPLHRIGRRPPRRLGQLGQGAPVPLPAPLRDQRRVQPLPPQQSALAGLVQLLVLGQDLGLVAGRVRPRRLGPQRHLRIRNLIGHGTSMGARNDGIHLGHGHRGNLLPRPLSSMNQALPLPRRRLTQRGHVPFAGDDDRDSRCPVGRQPNQPAGDDMTCFMNSEPQLKPASVRAPHRL